MVLLCSNADRPREVLPPIQGSTDLASASSAVRGRVGQAAAKNRFFSVASYHFQLPLGHESEQDEVNHLLTELARQVDLAEPFGRIEEAIREAQRLGGSGAETHDQAA